MNNSASQRTKDGKGRKIGDIFKAIDDLDTQLIENILYEDIDILYKFSEAQQEYPITYACRVGNLTPTKVLLEYIDEKDEFSYSMLCDAFMKARKLGHTELIRTLRKKMFGWSDYSEAPSSTPNPI